MRFTRDRDQARLKFETRERHRKMENSRHLGNRALYKSLGKYLGSLHEILAWNRGQLSQLSSAKLTKC